MMGQLRRMLMETTMSTGRLDKNTTSTSLRVFRKIALYLTFYP